jgi:hypothetical protein
MSAIVIQIVEVFQGKSASLRTFRNGFEFGKSAFQVSGQGRERQQQGPLANEENNSASFYDVMTRAFH